MSETSAPAELLADVERRATSSTRELGINVVNLGLVYV